MRPRPWHLLLLLAALIVPLQAGALNGGGGGGLSVSVNFAGCGVAETGITCELGASWSGVEGAERYTAAVTGADGSVTDLGTVGSGPGGGSTSLWVPYSGNGVYTVTVTAWGTDESGREEEVDEKQAGGGVNDEKQAGDANDEEAGAGNEDGGSNTGGGETGEPEPEQPEPPTDGGDRGDEQPGPPASEQPPADGAPPADDEAPNEGEDPAQSPDPAPADSPDPATAPSESTAPAGVGE